MNKDKKTLKFKISHIIKEIEFLKKIHTEHIIGFTNSINLDLSISLKSIGGSDEILFIILALKNSIIVEISSLFKSQNKKYPNQISLDDFLIDNNEYVLIKNSLEIRNITNERNKWISHIEKEGLDNVKNLEELFNPYIIDSLSKIVTLLPE